MITSQSTLYMEWLKTGLAYILFKLFTMIICPAFFKFSSSFIYLARATATPSTEFMSHCNCKSYRIIYRSSFSLIHTLWPSSFFSKTICLVIQVRLTSMCINARQNFLWESLLQAISGFMWK